MHHKERFTLSFQDGDDRGDKRRGKRERQVCVQEDISTSSGMARGWLYRNGGNLNIVEKFKILYENMDKVCTYKL